MKRKYFIAMTIGLLLCGITVTPHAALVNIGTATYSGTSYNLIYDADSPLGPITWLDYTNHSIASWSNMNAWAATLNNLGVITYNLNPGISANWSGNWRLWSTPGGAAGPGVTSTELGHLYHTELGNSSGGPLANTGPFSNLTNLWYWSNSNIGTPMGYAWFMRLDTGNTAGIDANLNMRGIAVRPGTVVPIPSAVLLLISGLIGIVGIRRKFKS